MPKYAIIIPYYNHPEKIKKLCKALEKYNLPILIVNDGSDVEDRKVLDEIVNIEILDLPQNGGKGYALKRGFEHLLEQGFTHALQIDADFQHNVDDVENFISQSNAHPDAYICGSPIYSDDIPRARLYGRKITNFWIYINTKGGILNDGMIGFRLYPLKTMAKTLKNTKANRMDFDTEVLVRAFWDGVDLIWLKTKIRYNLDAKSHFRALEDNILISKMHSRMFFYMISKFFRINHG